MNPATLRLAGGVIVALCVAWVGLVVWGWKRGHDQLPIVEQQLEDTRATLADVRAQHARELRIAQEASNGYQQELQALRDARDAAPARVVRLCSNQNSVRPAVPSAGGPHAATATEGLGPDQDGSGSGQGPDIGADLYAIADRCDDITAQLRGLQEWARAITTP